MLATIILTCLAGILIGTLTGIFPGIHINLVSAIVLSSSPLLMNRFSIPLLAIIVFIVSLSITHTFLDFISSIFLGAPDEDNNALSILPGHEMLIKGKAYEAVFLTLIGSLTGLVLIVLFTPLFILFLPTVYSYAQRIMPLILIIISFFLIYFEKDSKLWALIIFIVSGFLGLASFNLPIKDTLLPLFTGLFGVSSLIISLAKKQTLPQQEIKPLKQILPKRKSFFKSIFAALIASPLCSFLPGLGSGQAAVISSSIIQDLDRKEFLILLGSINTMVTGLSFVTLFSIDKARTGAAAAIQTLTTLTQEHILIILITIIFSGLISFLLAIKITKSFSKIITKINYSKLSFLVILLLILIVIIFSGFLGFLLMLISTCLGLACIHLNVRRTHLLGCLIIPSIIFSL